MDNINKEFWKPIVDYEGLYEVSSFGRVRSLPRKTTKGGIMSFYIDKSKRHRNYSRPTLRLSKNGKTKLHHICRLVALAFISNPENKPEVNHKDFNPKNNRVDNLEWTTRKENHTYSKERMACGEKHGMSKLTQKQVDIIRKKEKSPKRLAKEFNVTRQTIYRILNNRNWVRP